MRVRVRGRVSSGVSVCVRFEGGLLINLLAARRVRPRATGDSNVQEMLERVPAPDGTETAFFDAEYRRRLFLKI